MNQNFECHNKNMIFAFFIKRSDCHSAAVTLSERIFFTNSNASFSESREYVFGSCCSISSKGSANYFRSSSTSGNNNSVPLVLLRI